MINICLKKARLLFLSLAVFSCLTVFADTITLNNGRRFEGEVINETPSRITLKMSGGSISLRRSSIKSIEKSNIVASSQTNWRPVNALTELDPPVEMTDLALAYKKLKKDRFLAIQAKKRARIFQKNHSEVMQKIAAEKQRFAKIAEQLNSANPNRDLRGYNNLVRLQNQSTNKILALQEQLTKSFQEISLGKKNIHRYLQNLDLLKQRAHESKSKLIEPENKDQAELFWTKIETKLAKFDNEFNNLTVPHRNVNGHMILNIRINDRVDGRFLLDTGASFVTLSKNFAKP